MKRIIVYIVVATIAIACFSGGYLLARFVPIVPSPAEELTVVDDIGKEVTVPKDPDRIVSLCAPITEILYALGVGDKVVGVDKYSIDYANAGEKKFIGAPGDFNNYKKFCQEVPNKPNLGTASTPVLENLVKLTPQIVFTYWYGKISELEEIGLRVIAIKANSINDVFKQVMRVGLIVREESKAVDLIEEVTNRLNNVANKTRDIEKPNVYYELHKEFRTVGGGTLTNELIEAAGGENIFGNENFTYRDISREEVVVTNPDLIVIHSYNLLATRAISEDRSIRDILLENRPELENVPAIINNRVYILESCYHTYDLRFIIGVEQMAKWFHPTYFEG